VKTRAVALALVLAPAFLPAQTGGVVGVVVAKATGEPLAYSIVGLDSLERSAFASDSGRFGIREIRVGQHLIRVRRLGYTPRDVSIFIREGMTDTLRVELDRVAVSLGQITVKAWPPCSAPGHPKDSALSQIVQQVRLNAEQYRWMSTEYPFRYDIMITRTERQVRNGMVVPAGGTMERIESKAARAYKPGEVIYRRKNAIVFGVPTLAEVADKRFVENHCWHYGGVEIIDDEEVFRVDVVAFDGLKGADVNGSMFVNKNTFQIVRSIVHLSKRPSVLKHLLDFETTTDFFEVMPSISIPSHVFATQTYDPAVKSTISEAFEEQRTINFKFLGRKPGETKP
jgi:hypothetical protein